ncbi:MAG: hypothetical protein RLZZ610_871 [Actinomycetota bacterium]
MDGVIGHSGFIGSNLLNLNAFFPVTREFLESSDTKVSFDRLLIAAPTAEKWKANLDPSNDLRDILKLSSNIGRMIQAKKVLLFSTVDVYAESGNSHELSALLPPGSYGGNRARFESTLRSMFPVVTSVRLPALVGPGLKKNLLFDIKFGRKSSISSYNPESRFQFIDVRDGISIAMGLLEINQTCANVVSAPISISEVVTGTEFEPSLKDMSNAAKGQTYDIKTLCLPGRDYFFDLNYSRNKALEYLRS